MSRVGQPRNIVELLADFRKWIRAFKRKLPPGRFLTDKRTNCAKTIGVHYWVIRGNTINRADCIESITVIEFRARVGNFSCDNSNPLYRPIKRDIIHNCHHIHYKCIRRRYEGLGASSVSYYTTVTDDNCVLNSAILMNTFVTFHSASK